VFYTFHVVESIKPSGAVRILALAMRLCFCFRQTVFNRAGFAPVLVKTDNPKTSGLLIFCHDLRKRAEFVFFHLFILLISDCCCLLRENMNIIAALDLPGDKRRIPRVFINWGRGCILIAKNVRQMAGRYVVHRLLPVLVNAVS